MIRWLRLRFLEDRTCSDYKRCLTTSALQDKHFVPCYYCNGGKTMSQTFCCTHCQTIWLEETNNWVLTKQAKCPFCHHLNHINIKFKAGQLTGEACANNKATWQLDKVISSLYSTPSCSRYLPSMDSSSHAIHSCQSKLLDGCRIL